MALLQKRCQFLQKPHRIRISHILSCSLVLIILISWWPKGTVGSRGDRDYTFQNCLRSCKEMQCQALDYKQQPEYLRFLAWYCDDECKYQCMWKTVSIFQEHDLEIPQFYGKWPFVRFWGMQEPASVIFSLFNLIGHLVGLSMLRSSLPSNFPLISLWTAFTMVCINGWVWSMVFHTRDFAWTEMMDYFSAFSMNAFSFLAVFVRVFQKWLCLPVITIGVLIMSFTFYHVHYLLYVHFDYGYNMKANIAMGVLNAACWLIWSGVNRKTHPHVWKCALFVILAVASLVMEVFDFAPLFWIIDAHALWHLITAPITLIWYSFLIDDCKYLLEKQKEKLKKI